MTERNRLQPIEEWTAPVADFQDDEISAKAIAAQYVAMFGEKKTQLESSETDDDLFNHPSAIPVANRLRFLVDSNYDIEHFSLDEFLELDEVAAGLGTNEEELGNLVREMGVSDQFAPLDEFQNTVLAPGMDVVLAEELKWQAQYEAFEDFITIPALANYFNASYEIVRKVLRRADISPMVAQNGNHYYPKETAQRVRAEIMLFPPARDNKNMYQIMGELGCTQTWFVCNIGADADYGDLTRVKSGQVVETFPPEVQERLREKFSTRPGAIEGKKYTKSAIAELVNRDLAWVESRIRPYIGTAEEGIGMGASPHTHYDEVALEALQRQSAEEDMVPVMTPDMLFLEEMAALVGVVEETAEPVLKRLGIEPEPRMSVYNRKLGLAYKRSDVIVLAKAIMEERSRYLDSIDETIGRLGKQDRSKLSTHEKNRLRWAKMQRTVTTNRLQKARAVYDSLLEEELGELAG